MAPSIRLALLAALSVATTACGTDAGARAAAPAVRDSAGITIVENTAPAWAAGREWRLSATPVLSIGVMDGAPEYQLHRIRGARRAPDGRIIVTNGGTSELRIYSPEGRHLVSAGGVGAGPGEFRNIFDVALAGDSIQVWDVATQRLSIFTLDGQFMRANALGPGMGMLRFAGTLGDGTLVLAGTAFPQVPARGAGMVETRQPQEVVYQRVRLDGTLVDTIGRVSGGETIMRVSDGIVMMLMVTFAPNPQLTARDGRLVFAGGERYELEYQQPDGTIERLVRRAFIPERVTEEHLRHLGEERRAQAPPGASIADPTATPHAEYFPAVGNFSIDDADNVWVLEYRRPGAAGPATADVFDREGTWLGSVAVPERFRILDIGTDHLLGAWTDDFDVEYLHLYELIKP